MCKLQKIMASALFMGVFLLAVSGWAVSAGQARKAAAQSQGQSGTEANPAGQNANQPGVPGQSAAGAETPSVESAGVESGRVESSEIVTTKYGKILGKKTKKAYIWYGVPYGKTERWKAPVEPAAWNGIRSCKKSKKGRGDNCLFVNVYKPRKAKDEPRPVMVFLHGGGNVGGTANRNFTEFIQETDVIVVSVEFRQGAFGWFNSRGLKTGNRLTDGGNFAMLDIQLALEWVQQNIAAFDGDCNNVTLSGFSAGARDSLNCLISPVMKEKGLFHKVISFSGGMTTCSVKEGRKWSNEKLAQVLVRRGRFSKKKRALRYVKRLSKKKLKKLLDSLTEKEIRRMAGSSGLRLTNFPQCFRDGVVIPKAGFDCMEWGNYNRVPVLIGSNNSEFSNVSYKTMQRILTKSPKTFKNRKEFYRLLRLAKQYGSQLQSSFYLEKLAAKISADPYHSDIYTYRFCWGESSKVVSANYAKYVGAIHGMDVDFLLGRYIKGNTGTIGNIYNKANQPGREALSSVMRQYMKNFLYTGNPNGVNSKGQPLAQWNKWRRTRGTKRIMTFSATKKTPQVKMTSRYIDRTKCKRKMKRRLSKKTYRFLKRRILNDRFFM